MDEMVGETGTGQEVTGWSVRAVPEEEKNEACVECHRTEAERPQIGVGSSKDDIERNAKWIESTLTGILHKHTTQIRVTTSSKGW